MNGDVAVWRILSANIVSLAACILMVINGFVKGRKKYIIILTCEMFLFLVSNVLLMALAALITNAINVVRNLWSLNCKIPKVAKAVMIGLATVIVVATNTFGWLGYLPLFSFIVLTITLDDKDAIKIKWYALITLITWVVYDFMTKNYVGSAFDAVSIITTYVGIRRIRAERSRNNSDIKETK